MIGAAEEEEVASKKAAAAEHEEALEQAQREAKNTSSNPTDTRECSSHAGRKTCW